MFKLFATQVVVSKGYDGAPALKFSAKGDSVRFRIGKRVYDTRAENHTRWINMQVKAFGDVCERIRKMKLKEGSYIDIFGRLDEDVWEDRDTHEKKSAMVIILDDVEYCFSGSEKKSSDEKSQNRTSVSAPVAASGNLSGGYAPTGANQYGYPLAPQGNMPQGFTGYEAYGGGEGFF